MLVMTIIFILIGLFLIYSVIPTLLFRMTGIGVTQRIKSDAMALTFDDGPNPIYTPQLLDLLKKYHVKATFFVVGSKVMKYPDIIKRMAVEGHTIGIHHFNHVSSWFISPSRLKGQLQMTEEAISECTNEKVGFYRPPWGQFNLFSLWMSRKYKVIMWSHIFGDWKIKKCQNGLLEQLRSADKNGAIFVLHDCGETLGADDKAPEYMLDRLESFLKESTEKGIKFVSLKEI